MQVRNSGQFVTGGNNKQTGQTLGTGFTFDQRAAIFAVPKTGSYEHDV